MIATVFHRKQIFASKYLDTFIEKRGFMKISILLEVLERLIDDFQEISFKLNNFCLTKHRHEI